MQEKTPGERLARLEAQIEQLIGVTRALREDLREHTAWQRRAFEQQASRIVALEKSDSRTRAHLKWMKGIWAAAQAMLAAWIGTK